MSQEKCLRLHLNSRLYTTSEDQDVKNFSLKNAMLRTLYFCKNKEDLILETENFAGVPHARLLPT